MITSKSASKKKGKGKKKASGGKVVTSMMAKDAKEMVEEMDSSSGEDESSLGGEDDTLFKLVRGTGGQKKKKRRVNFIVTLAGGGGEYVPSRHLSMMIRDTTGGTGYIPERGRSEEAAPSGGMTDRVAVDTELAREVGFPPGEEASAAPTSGFGRELRKKRKRSKTKPNGKSEAVCLPCEDVRKAPDWPESTSSRWDRLLASGTSSDSSATTPVQRSSTSAPPTDRPTWGFMRSTQEETKDDKDWGVWVQEVERKWRDDKMRGSSPPPKVKRGQPGPKPYGVHLDSKGKECAPGWGSPRQESPLRSKELLKPKEGFVPIREESSCRSPDESAKQKTKRPFNRPRGKDATKRTRTPDSSPESEEEECSFMVRFKKGSKEAQVLFLGNEKSEGWEGPFDTSLSMEEVRDFSLKYHPRARGRSTSPAVSLGSDRYTPTSDKESESDSETSKGKEWKQFDGELDKYLTRGRGAGYRTILEAEQKTKDLRKTYYRLLSEEWSSLNPRYKVGESVWVCSKEDGVAKWRKACIQKVILPTELQYLEGMIDILYQTSQVPIGRKESVVAIGKESDIRPSKWGDAQPTIVIVSMPTNTDALHSMDVVGIDTCSALSVSTERSDFLFLDSSGGGGKIVSCPKRGRRERR